MIKRFHRGEVDLDVLEPFLETLVAYRGSFMQPMEGVHAELMRVTHDAGVDAEVTYRLKRSVTIFDKLKRESGLELDRMHDFGGCRAVVEGRDALFGLQELVESRFSVKRVYDYVENPRVSGYRAIHVIVTWDGKLIEVQLRTRTMHKWAETAEAFSSRLGQNFKQDGEHKVQQLLWALAEQSNAEENGDVVSSDISAKINRLIPEIVGLLPKPDERISRGNEYERN